MQNRFSCQRLRDAFLHPAVKPLRHPSSHLKGDFANLDVGDTAVRVLVVCDQVDARCAQLEVFEKTGGDAIDLEPDERNAIFPVRVLRLRRPCARRLR